MIRIIKWHLARKKKPRWFIVKWLMGLNYQELEDAIYALKTYEEQNILTATMQDSIDRTINVLVDVAR